MTRIRVVVTAEDIRDGARGEPQSCPVALALQRIGYSADVFADCWYPNTDRYDPIMKFPLSEGARAFIDAFDDGQTLQWMAPKVFYLEGPDR